MSVEQQVLLLYMLTNKYFSSVNVERVQKASRELLEFMEDRYNHILTEIRDSKVISDELDELIKTAGEEFFKHFT